MYKQIIINHQPMNYAVFSDGQIYSLARKRFLDGNINTRGYLTVHLSNHGSARYYQVARLVASAFLGRHSPNMLVIHKNGDKLDNHLSNLKWETSRKRIFEKTHEPKPIELIKGHKVMKFDSVRGAAKYLSEHHIIKARPVSVRTALMYVLRGDWKQTHGFRVKSLK